MEPTNQKHLVSLKQQMVLRRYSKNTINLYLHHVESLAKHCQKSLDHISSMDVRHYIIRLVQSNQLSDSTQHAAISAIKFFYKHILKVPIDVSNIPRPNAPKRLPLVLNRDEIERLLGAIPNKKHKTVLYLIYACGLRVGEAVSLRIADIDGVAGSISIRAAKGNKDRYVPISEGVLMHLRSYWRDSRPEIWLFPSKIRNYHVSARTIQHVFSQACQRAKIRKGVTVHSLRHSYATHLLEQGINIRYIQQILGHKSLKTTQIYTHISHTSINSIKSPAEFLVKDINIPYSTTPPAYYCA